MKRKDSGFAVVLVTCSSAKESEKLARGILQERLAACVNAVGMVTSYFWWKGKIDRGEEVLLIIKTRRSAFAALKEYVKQHHSYEVPEVILLSIDEGHKPYLDWIGESMRAQR